jgi:hypothetical protein
MTDNDTSATFQPVIREDGRVEAGGMTLFDLDLEGGPRMVFDDRCRTRAMARGTPDVPVDILALMEKILDALRGRGL